MLIKNKGLFFLQLFPVFSAILFLVQTRLLYASISLRHGARYPLSADYDIYDSNQTKPFSGQLTSVGMRQTYLLGSYIKAQYIDKQKLINSTLFTKQVQIFASSSERCGQSALSFCLGLFPFGTGDRLPENVSKGFLDPPFESMDQNSVRSNQIMGQFALKLGFQPTPFIVNNHFFKCSKQNQIASERLKILKPRLDQFQVQQLSFIQKLKLIFNLKPEDATIIGMTDVYDLIICDMYLGRKLPDQFTSQDFKQIDYIQAYLFPLVYSDKLARVFATPVLSYVLNNMENIIKKGKDQVKRFSIFTGHDTNLVSLLTYLNLTSPECIRKKYKNETLTQNCAQVVPFASNIIFQLHESDIKSGEFYVKVRYNGDYFNLCQKLSQQCEYEEFSTRVRANFIDYNKQCPNTSLKYQI